MAQSFNLDKSWIIFISCDCIDFISYVLNCILMLGPSTFKPILTRLNFEMSRFSLYLFWACFFWCRKYFVETRHLCYVLFWIVQCMNSYDSVECNFPWLFEQSLIGTRAVIYFFSHMFFLEKSYLTVLLSCHVRVSEWIYTLYWISRNFLLQTGTISEV